MVDQIFTVTVKTARLDAILTARAVAATSAEILQEIRGLRRDFAGFSARVESRLNTVVEALSSQATALAPLAPAIALAPAAAPREIDLRARAAEENALALEDTRGDTVEMAAPGRLAERPLGPELPSPAKRAKRGQQAGEVEVSRARAADEELARRHMAAERLGQMTAMALNWPPTNLALHGDPVTGTTGLAAAAHVLGIDVTGVRDRVGAFARTAAGKALIRRVNGGAEVVLDPHAPTDSLVLFLLAHSAEHRLDIFQLAADGASTVRAAFFSRGRIGDTVVIFAEGTFWTLTRRH